MHNRSPSLIYPLFLLSGTAGLLYQVVWTKRLILLFGASSHAVATTLAIFMLGLALGSRFFGGWADRVRCPIRWYGILEIAIALWGCTTFALLAGIDALIASRREVALLIVRRRRR